MSRSPTLRQPGFGRVTNRLTTRNIVVLLTGVVLIYLVIVPLVTLIYGSFSTGTRPGDGDGLTLSTYAEVLTKSRTYSLLLRSATYSLGSTLIGLSIGTTLAWLVHRTDLPFKRSFTAMALFPLVTPTILGVLAWSLLLDKRIGLINRMIQAVLPVKEGPFDVYSMVGMICVRGIMDIPLVFLWLWPAFRAMDPSLEEAAAIAGTRPRRVVSTITLPLMRPALLGTFLISFILSLDDLGVPILIGIPAKVYMLSTEVYLATTAFPQNITYASVNATLLLIVSGALTVLYLRATASGDKYAVVRGKGYRPRTIPLGRFRWPTTVVLAALMGLISLLPFLIVVWVSFTPFVQVPSIEGFSNLTTKWYRSLIDDPSAIRGFRNSAMLGLASGVIVLVMGLIIAWASVRSRMKGRKVLDFVAFAPIAIPGMVTGLSLVWLYLRFPVDIYGTLFILIIAYVTRLIPYGVRLLSSGLLQIHGELEEAASVAGSGWVKTLRTVTLPLLTPAIVSGFAYLFVRAYLELSSSLFLYSFGREPYSVVAFNYWDGGQTQKTAAYGIIALIFVAVVFTSISRLTRRNILMN